MLLRRNFADFQYVLNGEAQYVLNSEAQYVYPVRTQPGWHQARTCQPRPTHARFRTQRTREVRAADAAIRSCA